MSQSFDLLVDGIVDALRGHALPNISDEFARGQIFAIIFALNNLKLAADWKVGPLLEQVMLQDSAFASVRRLAEGMECPAIPTMPRVEERLMDSADLEALRDEGDRQIADLLSWTEREGARGINTAVMNDIERSLRGFIRDQLAIEIRNTAKSMLQEIATGEEGPR